jgi:uncharacterized sulfatase
MARGDRPNILFCISDDQSWIHTSSTGDPVVKTPNFDRVAREGVLFTNAYVSSPSCAPSRAAILTGQNFWQLEEGGLLFGRLAKKFPIFPKILERRGYDIGHTGKGFGPAEQRFNHTHKDPCGPAFNERETAPVYKGGKIGDPGISSTDYAANFYAFLRQRDRRRPFCFWYGSHEPHRPFTNRSGSDMGIHHAAVQVPPFLPDNEEVRHDLSDYLYEVEWFDQHLGRMIEALEEIGELENTIIVVTSDNGMPFPRGKATLYDYGVREPLAIRWGAGIPFPGRVVEDFVSHVDLAPTLLQAAGVMVPGDMNGRSLRNVFESELSGQVDPTRDMAVTGIERHVWSRQDGMPYPSRAIHTRDYTYIRNYEPERWPMGDPQNVFPAVGPYGDVDDSPTKRIMLSDRDSTEAEERFQASFGKRPAEELYATDVDPFQLNNLAADEAHARSRELLRKRMEGYQKWTKDPRAFGQAPWDDYPFYHDRKYLKGEYLTEFDKLGD